MRTVSLLAIASLVSLSSSPDARAEDSDSDSDYDVPTFSLTESFVRELAKRDTIDFTMRLSMGDHSKVHKIDADCEMHIAGTPDAALADSDAVVVEPPNLCRERAPGARSWEVWADKQVRNQDCEVSGFPRMFDEHALSGGGKSNPDHVVELHPATAIRCGATDTDISFLSYLKIYPKMRRVSDDTAARCLQERELFVRARGTSYEFKRSGGGPCGNFAVVAIKFYRSDWVHAINGGHSAIVEAYAGKEGPFPLKIYSLAGTDIDKVLAAAQAGQKVGRLLVHGMTTYDYFNIIFQTLMTPQRSGEPRSERTWRSAAELREWTRVPHPVSLVLFGVSPQSDKLDGDDTDGDD